MEMSANDNITAMYNLRQSMATSSSSESKRSTSESENDKSATKLKSRVALCSALGVATSLAVLSKFDKHHSYTINPLKMFKGSLKDCYLMKGKYKTKEIVGMGIGSALGGYIGGSFFDTKENSNAKLRESLVQITNVALPIAFVECLTKTGNLFSSKIMPNWVNDKNSFKKIISKLPATAGAMVGLVGGIYTGNKISNNINEIIFNKKDIRPVKQTDFAVHIDDICVAATFVAEKNPIVNIVSRLIPAALVIPGYETGTKRECH